MGEVYRARDEKLGRDVAMKVLPPGLATDREKLLRFAQEARTASALNHPNIVTIYEIGQAAGMPFIAMECVEGRTLRDMLKEGAIPLRRFLDISSQLADGIARAHEAGLIHRDLKPENVMISRDGFVKVLDFGLAKLTQTNAPSGDGGLSLTAAGTVVGTPGYMSPEQAADQPLDARSDQFSLGLIFYEMVTGKRAFQRGTAVQTMTAILQDEPEPITRLNPKVPPPVRWIVERCLSKDPEERYTSTRDLARDLRHLRRNAETLLSLEASQAVSLNQGGATMAITPATQSTGVDPSTTVKDGSPPVAVPTLGGPPLRTPVPLGRRILRVLGGSLAALAIIAISAAGGYFLRGASDGESVRFKGDLLIGESIQALAPQVSPDGKKVAFLTVVGGTAQVAVLDPVNGDWNVLTKRSDQGSAFRLTWSVDSSRIYFDRVADAPRGVFTIPAIGGDERLVLESAQAPEALPDGSLLIAQVDSGRNYQLARYEPGSAALKKVGPPFAADAQRITFRVFPDGKEALVWGRLAASKSVVGRQFFLLDLAAGSCRDFTTAVPVTPPFCVGREGNEILAKVAQGNLNQIVSLSRDGASVRSLLTLTAQPWYLSSGPGGELYVALRQSLGELIRFPVTGGLPERVAVTAASLVMNPVEFPDGRFLVPSLLAGQRRLLVTSPEGALRPLLDSSIPVGPPAVLAGSRVAFLSGAQGGASMIALTDPADGRLLGKIPLPSGAVPRSLAAARDGSGVLFPDAGTIWLMNLGNGSVKKICPGDGVAVHPDGQRILVQRNENDGIRLYLVPLAGGAETAIEMKGQNSKLAPATLSGTAINTLEQVSLIVETAGRGYWTPGLLDLASGKLTSIPLRFEGDIVSLGWTRSNDLAAMGVGQLGQLWRFHPLGPAGKSGQ